MMGEKKVKHEAEDTFVINNWDKLKHAITTQGGGHMTAEILKEYFGEKGADE